MSSSYKNVGIDIYIGHTNGVSINKAGASLIEYFANMMFGKSEDPRQWPKWVYKKYENVKEKLDNISNTNIQLYNFYSYLWHFMYTFSFVDGRLEKFGCKKTDCGIIKDREFVHPIVCEKCVRYVEIINQSNLARYLGEFGNIKKSPYNKYINAEYPLTGNPFSYNLKAEPFEESNDYTSGFYYFLTRSDEIKYIFDNYDDFRVQYNPVWIGIHTNYNLEYEKELITQTEYQCDAQKYYYITCHILGVYYQKMFEHMDKIGSQIHECRVDLIRQMVHDIKNAPIKQQLTEEKGLEMVLGHIYPIFTINQIAECMKNGIFTFRRLLSNEIITLKIKINNNDMYIIQNLHSMEPHIIVPEGISESFQLKYDQNREYECNAKLLWNVMRNYRATKVPNIRRFKSLGELKDFILSERKYLVESTWITTESYPEGFDSSKNCNSLGLISSCNNFVKNQ